MKTAISIKTVPKTKKKQKIFTIAVVTPIIGDQGLEALKACCELGYRISVATCGDTKAQKMYTSLADRYPYTFELTEDINKNQDLALDMANVVLLTEKPSKELLEKLQRKSVVPIVPEASGFIDFNAQKEEGNAFEYRKDSLWHMMKSIIRAAENHQFTYDWRNLQKNLKEL